jgi:hypothetical protein
MSIKSKVLATAATLTVLSGVGMAGALTAGSAGAATPSCGRHCVNIFSLQFGTHKNPNYLMDVWRQGAKVGQPIILFRASNSDPAEDFSLSDFDYCVTTVNMNGGNGSGAPGQNPGGSCGGLNNYGQAPDVPGAVPASYGEDPMTVAQFQSLDPVFKPATLVQYGNYFVYEFQYAPFGVDSGLCVGIPPTAALANGVPVSLQYCGQSASTLWIADEREGETFGRGYVPLINGNNTGFSNPFVLTYPQEGYPTDLPRPQLFIHTLETFQQGYPHVATQQLWGRVFGVFPFFH